MYCKSDKRLPLAADEAAGILGLDIQENAVVQGVFFDRGFKSQQLEEFFKYGFGLRWHNVQNVSLITGPL